MNATPARFRRRAAPPTIFLASRKWLRPTQAGNIPLHLPNIIEDGELREAATVKESLTVAPLDGP